MLKERKKRFFLVQDMDRIALMAEQSLEEGSTNRRFLAALMRATSYAEEHELTNRQQECFRMYYREGKKIDEIARALGLDRSTVSRHISAARERIRLHARYCIFAYYTRL